MGDPFDAGTGTKSRRALTQINITTGMGSDISSLISLIKLTIRRKELFEPGSKIVTAVSGGPDSVCLLHILYLLSSQWGLGLEVAHFEHGLRGRESGDDARFVEKLSHDFGLGFSIEHGNVRAFADREGIGIQEAARILRYDFLERVRADTESTYIATAHTADDQAEEVLMRLIRGAGLPGLSGIPWVRDNYIVRPLLGITRQQILGHLKAHDIPFVIDQSNNSRAYLRNRIRKDLLPLLAEDFNPAIVRTVNRTAEMLAEDHQLLEKMAETAYRDSLSSSSREEKLGFSIKKIKGHPGPIRRRIYRMALRDLRLFSGRVRTDHLLGIDKLVTTCKDPCASCRLPGDAVAFRRYEELFISSSDPEEQILDSNGASCSIGVTGPGRWPAPRGKGYVEISLSNVAGDFRSRNRKEYFRPLWLNPEAVKFPLDLRTRRPGEIFWPFGAPAPFKLKKFLISSKIPRGVRDSLPLLTSGKEVVAVVGVEVSHPYRLVQTSGKALSLQWIK
ncbi:MAG: tRNA lysidine(34) synthetase TilS [Deltaproteobacteria bacterium]|nr:tRNA lysidine(34) synthetase TilS [Deltaproteobacteria bacterium]